MKKLSSVLVVCLFTAMAFLTGCSQPQGVDYTDTEEFKKLPADRQQEIRDMLQKEREQYSDGVYF